MDMAMIHVIFSLNYSGDTPTILDKFYAGKAICNVEVTQCRQMRDDRQIDH